MTSQLRAPIATANSSRPILNQSHQSGLRAVQVTTECVIASQPTDAPQRLHAGAFVQVRGIRKCGEFQPNTPEQSFHLRALRSVRGPLTQTTVAQQLRWSFAKARHWLSVFSAKGVLIAGPKGHRWAA